MTDSDPSRKQEAGADNHFRQLYVDAAKLTRSALADEEQQDSDIFSVVVGGVFGVILVFDGFESSEPLSGGRGRTPACRSGCRVRHAPVDSTRYVAARCFSLAVDSFDLDNYAPANRGSPCFRMGVSVRDVHSLLKSEAAH
jgi:hypothetical protein